MTLHKFTSDRIISETHLNVLCFLSSSMNIPAPLLNKISQLIGNKHWKCSLGDPYLLYNLHASSLARGIS